LSGAVVAGSLAARAQHAGKVWRIGVLAGANAATNPDLAYIWNAFIEGLREHGYVEGRNITFERRYSEGQPTDGRNWRANWSGSSLISFW
jgi:hypothetical protein